MAASLTRSIASVGIVWDPWDRQDGPSAGVTMAVALVSLAMDIPVRCRHGSVLIMADPHCETVLPWFFGAKSTLW